MPPPLTLHGELRIPAMGLTHGRAVLEQDLRNAGLLPAHAEQCRWRMDTDCPGGYVLTYTVVLAHHEERLYE